MSMGMRFMSSCIFSRLFLFALIPLGACSILCQSLLKTVKSSTRRALDHDTSQLPVLSYLQSAVDDDDYENETSFTFGSDDCSSRRSSLQAMLASLPASVPLKSLQDHGDDDGQPLTCVVCLSLIAEEEEIRRLPHCRHLFHTFCIDSWVLCEQRTCPLCRASPLIAASNPTSTVTAESHASPRAPQRGSRDGDFFLKQHHNQHQIMSFPERGDATS